MLPITGAPIIIGKVAAFVADIHWVVIPTSADSDLINTAGDAENWESSKGRPLKGWMQILSCHYSCFIPSDNVDEYLQID